jgi:glutathione S-transferase
MYDVDELIAHLARTTRLDPTEARRAVLELLDLLSCETPGAFVQRRHRELKGGASALKNDTIFRQIAGEMAARPFAAPPFTERQIRRLIYG